MKKYQLPTYLADKRNKKRLLRKRHHQQNLATFKARDDYFHSVVLREKLPDEKLFITKRAPAIFSILKNRSETIQYFNTINGMLDHHTYTRMDFSQVQYTDLPTVCVLGAFLLDTKHESSPWEVKIPRPTKPTGKIWQDVQFDKMILKEKQQSFTSGSFLSRSSTKINTMVIAAILDATVDYFGENKRARMNELSAVINEIVENTTWHADPDNLSSIPWIINTRITGNDNFKEMEYCIVDLGVGVHDSIKENVTAYNTAKARAIHRLSVILDEVQSQSSFLSQNIPKGIGSRTNQETRGKGIRHVYNVAKSDIYSAFVIVTNKARVNLKDLGDLENDSQGNFFGTVYYWKIRIDE